MKHARTAVVAFATVAGAAALGGCTDAQLSHWGALGDEAHIICYSGGKEIFNGYSTGKVGRAESGSDGYYFKDKATGRLREVSGDCNVDFGAPAVSTPAAPGTPAP